MKEIVNRMNNYNCVDQLSYRCRQDKRGEWLEVLSYQGNEQKLSIPAEIQGCPVRAIGDRAFYHMHKLEEVVLPDSIERIGGSAFENCTGLVRVRFPRELRDLGNSAFCRCIALEEARLPGTLKKVARSALYGCCGLKALYLEEGIEEIDDWAFYGCSALEKISIPQGLQRCGRSAFDIDLARFVLDSGAVVIDEKLFVAYEGEEKKVNIPGGVTILADEAFRGNTQMEEVCFPLSLRYIGKRTFENCSSLQRVELLKTIRVVGENAFRNCTALKNLKIEDGVTSLEKGVFSGCEAILLAHIPESVCRLPDECFYGCRQLAAVYFPKTLAAIGSGAFEACETLEAVKIPEALRSIGDYAFYGSGLRQMTIPEGIIYVGHAMLGNCSNLKYVQAKAPLPNTGFLGAGAVCEFCMSDAEGAVQWKAVYADDLTLFSMSGVRDQFCSLFRRQESRKSAFESYDHSFDYIQNEEVKLKMAMLRIACPVNLSECAMQNYRAFLRAHSGAALQECMQTKDTQMLKCLCEQEIPQQKAVEAALEDTLAQHMVDFTAILTAYQSRFKKDSIFDKMMELALP